MSKSVIWPDRTSVDLPGQSRLREDQLRGESQGGVPLAVPVGIINLGDLVGTQGAATCIGLLIHEKRGPGQMSGPTTSSRQTIRCRHSIRLHWAATPSQLCLAVTTAEHPT